MLCSTSARTRETWDGAKDAFKASPDVRFLRDIYDADADYIDIIREHGKRSESLMLVGHNPSIQSPRCVSPRISAAGTAASW